MPDFIYTLDSEPESDIELDAAPATANDDAAVTLIESAGPGTTSTSSAVNKPKSKSKAKAKTSKTTTSSNSIPMTKSKAIKFSSGKKNDDEGNEGEDEDEDGGPAPTIDPSFNFDLTGGGASFFDGLGGGEEDGFGMGEDEVRSGTKPAPISVDDIIERRRKENPKLKAHSLKRKRDSVTTTAKDETNGSDVDMVSDEEDATNSLQLSEDEGGEEFGAQASDDEEVESDEDPLASDAGSNDNENESGEEDEDDGEGDSDDDGASVASSGSSASSTASQRAAKDAFFAPMDNPSASSTSNLKSSSANSFASLNLSRPLIRALTAMSLSSPTPIQTRTIPLALEGQDVLGSAVTGSGKTLAFLIPTLERLMYRERKGGKHGRGGEIRVLVLVPTRELAVQCADVGKSLARFTDITFGVIVGGLSSKAQEATLRARPDILIATPGRLIDHLQNTHSFSLSALDILILDEADRMLSDGFAAELEEIIRACPSSGGGTSGEGGSGRQTMLFSATMSDDVDRLVKLSMQRPVRLFVDPKKSLARGLTQEFVRVKRESERQAILLTICVRTARQGVIVFLRSKKLAHQMRVVFGILGLKATELHGDLTQEQRLDALKRFRAGDADYLLATDVASRGLDIKGVESVINYDMPAQIELYLHRVGRTARASAKGRAISLVGEADRTMLKAVIKRSLRTEGADDSIRHRLVPDEAVKVMLGRLEDIKDEISEVLQEEKLEKEIRKGEMEVKKGQNILEHEEEIFSRPKKTWFTSEKGKSDAQNVSKQEYLVSSAVKGPKGKPAVDPTAPKRDKFSGLSRRAKRRKMAMEDDKEYNDKAAVASAIRSAKHAQRPKKIGEDAPPPSFGKKSKSKKDGAKGGKKTGHSSVKQKVLGKDSKFKADMGARKHGGSGGGGGGSSEGMRAKKGDGGILSGKKGGKGKGGGGPKGKGRR